MLTLLLREGDAHASAVGRICGRTLWPRVRVATCYLQLLRQAWAYRFAVAYSFLYLNFTTLPPPNLSASTSLHPPNAGASYYFLSDYNHDHGED